MPFPTITPTIPALVRSSAARFGDKPFVVADGRELTYADLERRSARLAMGLLADGIGKGDHVGILMPNGIEWALAWFAATRIGAVAVPLNTFYKASELAWTARHADLRAILAWSTISQSRLPRAPRRGAARACGPTQPGPHRGAGSAVSCAPSPCGAPCDRAWATMLADDARSSGAIDEDFLVDVESCVTPADDVTIIYTSGSTGPPEGAGAHPGCPRPPHLQPHVPLRRHQRVGDVHLDAVLLGRGTHHRSARGHPSRRDADHPAGLRRGRSPGTHRSAPRDDHPRVAAAGQDARRASGLRQTRSDFGAYAPACPRWFRPTDDQRARMRWG